jgi:NodT family efflux transporter outer membrane factor (OMF) lipoprotein
MKRAAPAGVRLTALTTIAAVLASAMLLLSGCASPGDVHASHVMSDVRKLGASGVGTAWPTSNWWSDYQDRALDHLIEQALQGQPSLQTTLARLQQAQAAVDTSSAATLPQVNASVDMTDQRFTKNGLYPPPLAGGTKWSNNAQLGASWELDLFGRQRAALNASIGQLRAAQAEVQAARVLLASNVASGYFNLARIVENRRVAMDSLAQRQQVLDIVRQRIDAGLDTKVDLRQAEGLIAQSQVEIESLHDAAARARHALAELSGQGPHALDSLSPLLASVHSTLLPSALPADLLGRRADLVAQRWRVEAAQRNVDVARTMFYPNVSLTAFIGLSSLGLDKFLEAGSLQYGAGPALHLPIFEGGRLRANLSSKSADVDIAVDGYNTTLLRALREVADEMSTLKSLERQQRAQTDASVAADGAYELALQRYKAGLGNFLTVLTAQTNVLAQQRASTELKARHLTSEVALTRALGGGFDAATQMPTLAAAH